MRRPDAMLWGIIVIVMLAGCTSSEVFKEDQLDILEVGARVNVHTVAGSVAKIEVTRVTDHQLTGRDVSGGEVVLIPRAVVDFVELRRPDPWATTALFTLGGYTAFFTVVIFGYAGAF